MSIHDDKDRHGALDDEKLASVLRSYGASLQSGGEAIPEAASLRIRTAITAEAEMRVGSKRRSVQRSVFALAASVAALAGALGVSSLVSRDDGGTVVADGTGSTGIRSSADDTPSVATLEGGAESAFIPTSMVSVALSQAPGRIALVSPPSSAYPDTDLPVVFVLEDDQTTSWTQISDHCNQTGTCVGVLVPRFTDEYDDPDAASMALAATQQVDSVLGAFREVRSGPRYVKANVNDGDLAVVTGVQRGLFEPLTNLELLR